MTIRTVYYWKKQPNWGDRLNYSLLKSLNDVQPAWRPPEQADLVLIGSVLEHLPPSWSGTVCGAGKLHEGSRVDLSRAKVLALRGKLTAASVTGVRGPVVLGDPALLTPQWIRQWTAKYDLGVVPHWSDTTLRARFPYGHFIDPTQKPEDVVTQIAKCKRIVSSSLHGIIVADAYGIPRQAELFPQAAQEGGDFKFRDYASVYDTHPHFGEMWLAPHDVVERIQTALREVVEIAVGLVEEVVEDAKEAKDQAEGALARVFSWGRFPHDPPQISLLVPFRDDGEHRTRVWHWLRRYWLSHLDSVEVVQGHDFSRLFNKPRAVNNAAEKARGRIVVILDADAYLDSHVLQYCADAIETASRAGKRRWFMPYCTDSQTQVLTSSGWKSYDEVKVGDLALTLNHESGLSEWQPVEAVSTFEVVDEPMLSFESATHSSFTTMNHRWPVLRERRVEGKREKSGQEFSGRYWATSETLTRNDHVPIAAECGDLPVEPKYTDAFVEVVAWAWTEGTYHKHGTDNIKISQSKTVNPHNCERIRAALTSLAGPPVVGRRLDHTGTEWREYTEPNSNTARFYLGAALSRTIKDVAPERVPSFEFLLSLTRAQLSLFIDVSIMADGSGRSLSQKNPKAAEAFQFACILAGHATSIRKIETPTSSTRKYGYAMTNVHMRAGGRTTVPLSQKSEQSRYTGIVWCPTTANATWLARRNGTVYFTGNTNLYRVNRQATQRILYSDPQIDFNVPSPPPSEWIEDGGPLSANYGHQYGAMVQIMSRRAFFAVGGMDPRFSRGWGSEDASFMRALDTLWCQHENTPNDLLHLWHTRTGTDWKTRRWVGQPWSPANSRLAQRYANATGEYSYMRGLVDEHIKPTPLPEEEENG